MRFQVSPTQQWVCVIGSTSISRCRPSADNAEPTLPSDCESCRTLAVLSRLNNGPNSTQPETSSFLQSVCFHYPNAIPKVWPSTTSARPFSQLLLPTNWQPSSLSVRGLHQDLRPPTAKGFREPDGQQTCLWSKKKVLARSNTASQGSEGDECSLCSLLHLRQQSCVSHSQRWSRWGGSAAHGDRVTGARTFRPLRDVA